MLGRKQSGPGEPKILPSPFPLPRPPHCTLPKSVASRQPAPEPTPRTTSAEFFPAAAQSIAQGLLVCSLTHSSVWADSLWLVLLD